MFCFQKLVLGKAGAPRSDPGTHKQGNNSANLDFPVVHFGMSKSRLSSSSMAGAPYHTCCCAELM